MLNLHAQEIQVELRPLEAHRVSIKRVLLCQTQSDLVVLPRASLLWLLVLRRTVETHRHKALTMITILSTSITTKNLEFQKMRFRL